uniref:Ovule protein n=1 Tax=Heterorhabditis bacteriophora TaxID=37862 RepID=A0A1I7WSJ7_HETBA
MEPPVCLVFPQPAVNQPVEIKKVEDFVNETLEDEHEEQEKNSSGSKILSAVERFLTANRSDGETETERRREKKKHLRNQVRGSSMVAMDRVSESDEKLHHSPHSPMLTIPNGIQN